MTAMLVVTGAILLLPDPKLPFVLNCDASGYAIGATLQQDQGNGLQPVAYRSKKLSPARYTRVAPSFTWDSMAPDTT